MKDTIMTMMKKAETHKLINELANKCTLDKTVSKNKVIDTDGVPFVFIDNDGDEKIFSPIFISSTRMKDYCRHYFGQISNDIDRIITMSSVHSFKI